MQQRQTTSSSFGSKENVMHSNNKPQAAKCFVFFPTADASLSAETTQHLVMNKTFKCKVPELFLKKLLRERRAIKEIMI